MWWLEVWLTVLQAAAFLFALRNLRDYAVPNQNTSPPNQRLFILIPARNEEENIGQCLQGVLEQTLPSLQVRVLDDNSEDSTLSQLEQIAALDSRLKTLHGKPLPAGWAGKVWACRQLGEAALQEGADWLLFLDADTRMQPELAALLLGHAIRTQADMVSTFPYQITQGFWEGAALPMLHFLILAFLPVRMVPEKKFPQIAAACGQVELFSAEAYKKINGHDAIPASFHDGLQLARRIKAHGLTLQLCDASPWVQCRMYRGGRQVWQGFTRNAYEGLGGPIALLVMTLLEAGLYLWPFLALCWCGLTGWPVWGWLVLVQVLLILLMRTLQAKRFASPVSVLLHPVSISLLIAVQWASFLRSMRRSPIRWKGRSYP